MLATATPARAMLLSVRGLPVQQRTQLMNSLRGHAAEFGIVAPPGDKGVAQVLAKMAGDASLPKWAWPGGPPAA